MKTRTYPRLIAVVVAVLSLNVWRAYAADHVAEIDISVTRGAVGSHFSVYGGHGTVAIDGHNIEIPFTSKFTKLASRDDSSAGPRRVTPDNPWRTTVQFSGPGRFIFDISDWDGDPAVSVLLKIDEKIYFKGSGTASNYDAWTDRQYGPGVQKTDDREIAFTLP
jgi:hypothetical protein